MLEAEIVGLKKMRLSLNYGNKCIVISVPECTSWGHKVAHRRVTCTQLEASWSAKRQSGMC